ncbi:MAG: hypothetical protein HYX75_23250 [Acidobacteria bacterium]|nr:hypothetical protein [Acidobacteriota bacterium]
MSRSLRALVLISLLPGIPSRTETAEVLLIPSVRTGFSPVGSGARGLGMGGAFIAVADDGTAATFNPAGLASLRSTEVALVAFRSSQSASLSGRVIAPDRLTSLTLTDQAPDFAGAAVPFEVASRNLTLQVSYQRVADIHGVASALQDYRYDDPESPTGSWDVSYLSQSSQAGAFHTISLAGGYQLTEFLSVGAAFNYWIGAWSSAAQSDLLLAPTDRPAEVYYLGALSTGIDAKLRGINGSFGFLVQHDWINVGGVLRAPLNATLHLTEEDSGTVYEVPEGEIPYYFYAQTRSKLHWPRSAGLGIAIRPFGGLTVAADFIRTNWSETTVENVRSGVFLTPQKDPAQYSDLNYFDLQPAAETQTADNSLWRAGVEYLLVLPKVVVPIRAGHYRDRSPFYDLSNPTGRPIKGWTFGSGLNFQHLVLDVAGERRESEGIVGLIYDLEGNVLPVPPSDLLSEKVRVTRVVVSLIYRFDRGNDPIKGFLRRIFGGGD